MQHKCLSQSILFSQIALFLFKSFYYFIQEL